jgi:large subunit ribosomal protein L9
MAQAILLQDVENVGSRGEVIDVSPGYLRNYLLPRKLAHAATPGALAEAKRRMEAAEQAARDAAERAQENAALLSRTVLTIPQPAGEDGRLFGSVTPEDIVNAIKQARGLKLDRRKVQLEQPIRTTGTHMVTVEVHEGVTADVKTIVTPEG